MNKIVRWNRFIDLAPSYPSMGRYFIITRYNRERARVAIRTKDGYEMLPEMEGEERERFMLTEGDLWMYPPIAADGPFHEDVVLELGNLLRANKAFYQVPVMGVPLWIMTLIIELGKSTSALWESAYGDDADERIESLRQGREQLLVTASAIVDMVVKVDKDLERMVKQSTRR